MKIINYSLKIIFVYALSFFYSTNVQAQLWKRIKDQVKQTVDQRVEDKAVSGTNKTIDKTSEKTDTLLSNAVHKLKKGGKKNSSNDVTGNDNGQADINIEEPITNTTASTTIYKNYDFVPGDKIIFQPDLSSEPDAELPARFIIKKGNAEIQTFNGEKILHLQADGGATVAPLMSSENYLPEQFTLEFDMMYENEGSYFAYASDFNVTFRTPDENNYYGGALYTFTINNTSRVKFGDRKAGSQEFPKELQKSVGTGNTWHHIAIYVRKNIGKAYIDQYRVSATNTLPSGAGKVDIQADRYGIKIKNLRLAAGGDDKYNKIVTDGKFITHGILFDVNQSSMKPESMGALNEIAKLLKEHNDLNFEIDGHTDSDGNDDTNMKLSQSRADAVKAQLIEMGIDESRLKTKGFGATKPIDKNDNAEGKANNRRVEFVKI